MSYSTGCSVALTIAGVGEAFVPHGDKLPLVALRAQGELEDAVEAPKPAKKATGNKNSAAAGTSSTKATSARVTRARTAKPTDPTVVPAKRNG